MKKEYQKHIVSNDKHIVRLHRVSKDKLIENILREGFYFGADIDSSTTHQPSIDNLEGAEGLYRAGNDYGKAVIVIKIPRELHLQGYEGNKEVTYWHPEKQGFAIQRKHIHGWIDKATDEYHPNPYLNEPQNLTDKHFPPQMYGGLEKDLISEKPTKTPKLKKQKKLKKGELPPPPKETVIP